MSIVKRLKIGRRRVVIRHPVWKDVDALAACWHRLYRESKQYPLWIPTAETSVSSACDKLAAILKGEKNQLKSYLMVELNGRIEGQGWIDLLRGQFGEGYCSLGIQLTRPCRGLGIGRLLMRLLEREALRLKQKGIFLYVASRNKALALYQRCGYKIIAVRPLYVASTLNEPFDKRADLITMLKVLDRRLQRHLKDFRGCKYESKIYFT